MDDADKSLKNDARGNGVSSKVVVVVWVTALRRKQPLPSGTDRVGGRGTGLWAPSGALALHP